jgi:hypothetical protein
MTLLETINPTTTLLPATERCPGSNGNGGTGNSKHGRLESNNNGDKCLQWAVVDDWNRAELILCLEPTTSSSAAKVPDLSSTFAPSANHRPVCFELWRDDRTSFAVGWVVAKR